MCTDAEKVSDVKFKDGEENEEEDIQDNRRITGKLIRK